MFNITVRLTASIARYTGNQKTLLYKIEDNADLAGLLERLGHDFPGLKNHLCDKEGRIIDSVNVYVNGDNVRYVHGKETKLNAGDELDIIPAAAAG
jgi:molybdopterin synthase sulfur carrier subunit